MSKVLFSFDAGDDVKLLKLTMVILYNSVNILKYTKFHTSKCALHGV